MTVREARAFAPGRVNLIGEHTDYNRGLALPFAIAEGVTVRARAVGGGPAGGGARAGHTAAQAAHIHARALDLAEEDAFALPPPRAAGWRAFVRGVAAELRAAGVTLPAADLEIAGDVPRGAGLSSSAALEVALALALLALAGACMEERELAGLCARVEGAWVGAHTGRLDQLASLCGREGHALRIDFADLRIDPVPLALAGGWQLVTLDSGEPRVLAASGYNARRGECARACELLGVGSLREAHTGDVARLPEPLARRVAHVLGENTRVRECVAALRAGDLPLVGALLDASHASLRDLYECSTPAVEAAVERLRAAGAVGARMVGGGFGGHVLGLLPPGASAPPGARAVRPSGGARVGATEVH
jgi:galactokinase